MKISKILYGIQMALDTGLVKFWYSASGILVPGVWIPTVTETLCFLEGYCTKPKLYI